MTRRAHPADVFHAVAELRRREVLAVLADGREYAMGEIVVRMKRAQPAVSRPAVSQHPVSQPMGVLGWVGVVTAVRRGRHRMYRLEGGGPWPVREWMRVFERYWNYQVDQIRQRAEVKALERMIRLEDGGDDGTTETKEEE